MSRLDVDLKHPTGHDCEVIFALRWQSELPDAQAQAAVTSALDVEAVTARFYKGLKPHFTALEHAIDAAAARSVARTEAIAAAGGPRRVAIRILTQILFCYFLQRKRLLAGDRDYLSRAYSQHDGLFYPAVLEPLFYETLAVPPAARKKATTAPVIPFLNGGLFERRYGDVSLDLPDHLFDLDTGLLGYLNHWTFTVAEETADEVEVAVDPEMLGRIFESLLPDREREQKGTYYTPRPVVQFMCREALVARLTRDDALPEDVLRTLLSADDPLRELRQHHDVHAIGAWAHILDSRLAALTILDPAVGSGAFLLGMLAEIVRLRGIVYEALHDRPASEELIHAWKLHAIERSLFGVDIEPTAIELCRLRLWLSLVVELDASRSVPPLPNLEYRILCANSLVDFVEGIPIQDTRRVKSKMGSLFGGLAAGQVVQLRATYFKTADPNEKAKLRGQLLDAENQLLDQWLEAAQAELREQVAARKRIDALKTQLRSPDRVYPVFMPGFSAPDVWKEGGWEIVIMNPPYVGRKEIPQRYPQSVVDAIIKHYGSTRDLMTLFGERALELVRPDCGVMSMIFNDSIFTSTDADAFRRSLFTNTIVTVIARTKCFEGQAVNGGVIVACRGRERNRPVRWVEGYRRPVEDFAGASAPLPIVSEPGAMAMAGRMEVFLAPEEAYLTLPHRPLFRPSTEAIRLLDRFTASECWSTFSQWGSSGWEVLSNTRALERTIRDLKRTGFYTKLQPGDWVLLGLVSEGGQGLATADDRRFLGAVEGTKAAEEHREFQQRLENLTRNSGFADEYNSLLRTYGDREAALLALWAVHGAKRPCPLPWPRTGTFRVVSPDLVRASPLGDEERKNGISGPQHWVPFEKGDQSQEVEDQDGRISRIGAAWDRENPLVIDWSREAVALLRRRANTPGAQRPYFRNEHLWFNAGVTWNRVASYLRVRVVTERSGFSDMAPLLRPFPLIEWLSPHALLALLNSDVIDFMLRTFLGSRMHIEVGDVRRLVVPVLAPEQKAALEDFADRAIAAKRASDVGQAGESLVDIQKELNGYVRDIYGIPQSAELWVVR
ncbi:Eco57I restriction-modification methylase domain-containing protein [Nitrolancea hollandica]|uniref:Eco57I restriction-modification methylase domain-containing protein n=1 Tax=Nitrolancea hollandica TaxID=1206749 RepID=UPI00135F1741|nr:DNA methyltransferase [Nitrolancea hollandica]